MYRRSQSYINYGLALCTAVLLFTGCTHQVTPFVGAWKNPNGATFIFHADKTATINGKAATWTENNGIIEITRPGTAGPMRLKWALSTDGKQLSTWHDWSKSGPAFVMDKQ